MLEIVDATAPAELDAIRQLFAEYKQEVGVDLWFGQGFRRELEELPKPYLPPEGRLILARSGGEVVGCGGMRPVRPGIVELRRLWVRRSHRKQGAGRAIADALVTWARGAGARAVRTYTTMPQAEAMFVAMGFTRGSDERTNPFPGSTMLELRL
jgi:carbonic anhydrase